MKWRINCLLYSLPKKATHAGTFTYDCQRLNYWYIGDTSGIRSKLISLYENRFPTWDPYINIKHDPDWDAYMKFLYPNEETFEFNLNLSVAEQLNNAGDDLSKARPIDHYLIFPDEKHMAQFIAWAEGEGYEVKARQKRSDRDYPYLLHIIRDDFADPSTMTPITLELKRKAESFDGIYEGWETILIKN